MVFKVRRGSQNSPDMLNAKRATEKTKQNKTEGSFCLSDFILPKTRN